MLLPGAAMFVCRSTNPDALNTVRFMPVEGNPTRKPPCASALPRSVPPTVNATTPAPASFTALKTAPVAMWGPGVGWGSGGGPPPSRGERGDVGPSPPQLMAAIMTTPAAQRLSAISYKLTLAAAMMLAGGFGPMMKLFVMSAASGHAAVAVGGPPHQPPPA